MNARAIATARPANFLRMAGDIQEWRRERLRALARKFGGNAPLGRALGYADGAFVGQMLAGLRPITEKTIEAAEKLQGAKGWFNPSPPPSPGRADVFEELTADEKAFIENFRALLDSDRIRLMAEVAQRASELRDYLAQHGRPDIPLVAKPRHSEATRAPAKS